MLNITTGVVAYLHYYYTLYSLTVFSLAKSLQLILEISATYRLVSYLLADNWLICRLRAKCMISTNNINSGSRHGVFVIIFFKTMYNKTTIRFSFCDILNNQGLGKCYHGSWSLIPRCVSWKWLQCVFTVWVNYGANSPFGLTWWFC